MINHKANIQLHVELENKAYMYLYQDLKCPDIQLHREVLSYTWTVSFEAWCSWWTNDRVIGTDDQLCQVLQIYCGHLLLRPQCYCWGSPLLQLPFYTHWGHNEFTASVCSFDPRLLTWSDVDLEFIHKTLKSCGKTSKQTIPTFLKPYGSHMYLTKSQTVIKYLFTEWSHHE